MVEPEKVVAPAEVVVDPNAAASTIDSIVAGANKSVASEKGLTAKPEPIKAEVKAEPVVKTDPKADPPKAEEKKEPAKAEPIAKAEPSKSGEDIDYDAIINDEINKGTDKEKKAVDPEAKPFEETTKDTFKLKEIAEKLNITAEINSVEDLEKAISKKTIEQTRWQEPLRATRSNLSDALKWSDEVLVTEVIKQQNPDLTADELTEYITNLKESKGEKGMKNEALAMRASLRGEIKKIDQQLEQGQNRDAAVIRQQEEQFTREMRDTITSVKEVNGVPLTPEQISKNADFVLSRAFDKVLNNPKEFAKVAAMYNNMDTIVTQAKEQAARTAVAKFKTKYIDGNLFNKDIGNLNAAGGRAQEADKPKDINAVADAAIASARDERNKNRGQ